MHLTADVTSGAVYYVEGSVDLVSWHLLESFSTAQPTYEQAKTALTSVPAPALIIIQTIDSDIQYLLYLCYLFIIRFTISFI